MWCVWSFTETNGWQQLGCFDSYKQACEYTNSVSGVSVRMFPFEDVMIVRVSDPGLLVVGTNDMLRRLFNVGNQPS